MIQPIDLKALAGDRYRLALDPSADAEPRSERAWFVRIPCKRGFISPHGPGLLAGYGSGRVVARLLAIPGARVHQRGDQEVRVLFGPESLDAVADVLGARRRRRLSPDARERAMANLAASRFCHTQGALLAAPCDSPALAR